MKKFELGEFINMILCFGEIFSTEEAIIKRGNILEGNTRYLKSIVYETGTSSYTSDTHINVPEWIKLNVLNILEYILGDNFCYEEVRKLVSWSWEMKKIKPGKGRYEGFGLGYSMLLSTITDEKDQINIEILNEKGSIHYYRFTFKYKNKKQIYYVPVDNVYNKDFREVFPIY